MTAPRPLRVACALALAALLAAGACGTTVPEAQRQAAVVEAGGGSAGDQLGEDALGAPGATGGESSDTAAAGGVGSAAAPGTRGGRAAGGAAGGTGGASGAAAAGDATGTGGAAGGANNPAAPGLTDTTINVGILVSVNSGAANSAIGAGGIDAGDPRRNAEIVINDMNERGGIAGRKIVPVFHEFDATSAEPDESQFQAACENFTQDHKVFAVMSGGSDSFLQCLTKAGVVIIEENGAASDAARFRTFPTYFELNMSLDRIAAVLTGALDAQKYFTGWDAGSGQPAPVATTPAKVGIVTVDTRSFAHAVDDVLVPALRRLGVAPTPDNIVRIAEVRRQQDVGEVAPAVSSAVLRFRTSGVTHVLIFESNAIGTLLFANTAESQNYHPRYGVTSGNGQQVLLDAGAYPSGQLNGIVGIGWLPNLDIKPAENPDDGPYSNESRRRCIDLYKRNGVTYDNANASIVALTACNSFNLLKLGLETAPALTRDGFVAAMNSLGSRFESATTFVARYDAEHHDGAAAYRHWAYVPSCGCMRYSGGNVSVDS